MADSSSKRHLTRVNCSFNAEQISVLKEFAKFNKKPVATLVSDCIIELIPVMELTLKFNEKAKVNKDNAISELQLSLLNQVGNTIVTLSEDLKND